jgi:hypothetical protein
MTENLLQLEVEPESKCVASTIAQGALLKGVLIDGLATVAIGGIMSAAATIAITAVTAAGVAVPATLTAMAAPALLPLGVIVAATTAYAIRDAARHCDLKDSAPVVTIADYLNMSNQDVTSIIAGTAGGTIKYGLKGSNPLLGAFNNIAYELVKNYELDKTTLGGTITAMLIEGAEEGLGNGVASVPFGYVVGLVVAGNVYSVYVPVVEMLANIDKEAAATVTSNVIIPYSNSTPVETCDAKPLAGLVADHSDL